MNLRPRPAPVLRTSAATASSAPRPGRRAKLLAFTVNGELVEDFTIRGEVRLLRPRYEQVVQGVTRAEAEAQLQEWSRENIIERVILRQEALADPAPITPEEIDAALQEGEQRADVETRLRIERLLKKVTSKVSPPRHKDINEFYLKHKHEPGFETFEQVRELIESGLFQRKKERVIEQYLDRLRAKAAVVEV